MSDIAQAGGKAVTERLLEAMNAHNLEGHLACFNDDYRSEQPAHPARTFSGRKQVRENWSKVYESIPDFRAELLRLAVVGEEEWGEWIWRGTKEDGTSLRQRRSTGRRTQVRSTNTWPAISGNDIARLFAPHEMPTRCRVG
jgi:hypothetical protein